MKNLKFIRPPCLIFFPVLGLIYTEKSVERRMRKCIDKRLCARGWCSLIKRYENSPYKF